MEKIKIVKDTKNKANSYSILYIMSFIYNFISKKFQTFLIIINFALVVFLLYFIKQTNKLYRLNSELNFLKSNNIIEKSVVDKDMVGVKYPEIDFKHIKYDFLNGKIISSYFDLLKQLETKLIYLENEINCTKLIKFKSL